MKLLVKSKREEIAVVIDNITRFCGIDKTMFTDISFTPYQEHMQFAHNWHVYYRALLNHSFNADVLITPVKHVEGAFEVDRVNFTFILLENREIKTPRDFLYVRIFLNESDSLSDEGAIRIGKEDNGIIQGKIYKTSKNINYDVSREKVSLIFLPHIEVSWGLDPKWDGRESLVEFMKRKKVDYNWYYLGSPTVIQIT
ncbi:hypothetical protein HY491_00470 [Candidatus Woesearchaeota archaeon]|nr:hypothetical protein [Candidatus Woesearchaeota archaeon]